MSIQSRSHQYGIVFENWKILELLGQGSGGKTAVFRLKRIDSNRGQSALKVINLIEERGDYDSLPVHLRKEYDYARDDCKRNALQEVWLMDSFQGLTNIVDYLDHKFVDWSDDTGFGCDMLIRMELLTDLRREIRSGKVYSEEDVINIGCDICRALILCHENNILHRDIKPENIFVNRNGNYKLGDFGVSRIISNAPMSMASTSIGTLEYAAPEQTSGKYDKRVDIYSLGLVLYELSNQCHLPFANSFYIRPNEVNMRMAGVSLPVPSGASKNLAAIILKACAFKPEDRYQTAQEFADALGALNARTNMMCSVCRTNSAVCANPPVSEQKRSYNTEPVTAKSPYATIPTVKNRTAAPAGQYQTVPAAAAPKKEPEQSNNAHSSDSSSRTKVFFQSLKSLFPVKQKSSVPATIEQMIKQARKEGTGKEKYDIGMGFYEGKICPRNYERAVEWFTEAANANYAPAATALGRCYFLGHGVRKNVSKALAFYARGREGGDPEGAFLLGHCYELGIGTNINYQAATECYSEAAEKNHALAMRYLAICYESSGRGVKHDAKMAFTLYQKAAEAGDTKSMIKMADYYWYGQFVKPDPKKSYEWYDRAIALGDVEAMCKLAKNKRPLFDFSREQGYSVYHVEKRCRESIQLYKMAAERNCEEAIIALDRIRRDLIAEKKQDDLNYRNLATNLLNEYWPLEKK